MCPRELSDDELRLLTFTHCGLTAMPSFDRLAEPNMPQIDPRVIRAVLKPFIANDADLSELDAVIAELEAEPDVPVVTVPYSTKLQLLLASAVYGRPN